MSSMRVGLTTDAASLPDALRQFPSMAMCRVFGTPGKGIPSWTDPTITLLRAARKLPWVSFKDWPSDATAQAAVNTWLDQMPADCPEVWLTFHHEPEGDLDAKEYRRRWTRLATAVRAHRNRARVRLVPIHTLYPARHKLGDTYSRDFGTWIGVWQQWAPTDNRGNYLGDYMGWDCYLETTAPAYEAPETFLRIPVGAAVQAGVPLVLPELGSVLLAGDTGTGRARWITDALTYLRTTNCAAVNWWHAIGSAGQDYRLRDSASANVWQKATEGLI